MSASYVLVRCPVCSGSGAVQCGKGSANPSACIIPLRLEERCDCCDGRGWVTKEQTCSLFCAREGRRR